tara:strand:+ start:630 stop:782 length:153 start_codon:yes stop_codon:yes gene_type:complete
MVDILVYYSEFQNLKTVNQKVKYLKKNKDLLESNFNIRVDNLILSWESKL